VSKSPDTGWKTIKSGTKMGDTDEWSIGSVVQGILSRVPKKILGQGYDPELEESICSRVSETLKERDVVLYRNPPQTTEVVLHTVVEGDNHIKWSMRQNNRSK